VGDDDLECERQFRVSAALPDRVAVPSRMVRADQPGAVGARLGGDTVAAVAVVAVRRAQSVPCAYAATGLG